MIAGGEITNTRGKRQRTLIFCIVVIIVKKNLFTQYHGILLMLATIRIQFLVI